MLNSPYGLIFAGVSCFEGVYLTGVTLTQLSLVGTLPTQIGLLTTVSTITLSRNGLSGTIPSEIALLPLLSYLDLSNNDVEGGLPLELQNLTSLTVLLMESNSLYGSVPTFLSSMTQLRTLDLHSNLFDGEVPSMICGLVNSTQLRLDKNPDLICNQPCNDGDTDGIAIVATLPYCAPTAEPTAEPTRMPISPIDNQLHVSSGAVAGIVVGAVVFVSILIGLWLYWRARNHDNVGLPVHEAIFKGIVIDEDMLSEASNSSHSLRFSSRSLTSTLLESAKLRNKQGKTAIELIVDRLDSYSVNENTLRLLVMDSLHFNQRSGELLEDENVHNYAWATLVQSNHPTAVRVVEQVLEDLDDFVAQLTVEVDSSGRRLIDIASPACKDVMLQSMYLHRRFELKPGAPEHKSATSVVQFATDHRLDAEGNKVESKVALKFMRHRQQYLSEIATRSEAGFSSEHVLLVLESFDGDDVRSEEAVSFRASAQKKGFAEYPYCLVMDVADTNLQRVIFQQHIVGSDWDMIKLITKSLCSCVGHVHSRGVIHGDLKPMNVVLLGNSVRLIDFDACARFAVPGNENGDETEGDYVGGSTVNGVVEYAGSKYSSAYLPPELFFQTSSGKIVVKSFEKDVTTGLPMNVRKVSRSDRHSAMQHETGYDLVPASPAVDMWAIGAILYLLCTGVTLFQASVEDNIPSGELGQVLEWSDALKESKLSAVEDKYARNLLSLLLDKDPARRPDPSHVMSHPFISGVHPHRMMGDPPTFDVFLSYRVDSDSDHVEMMYNALTEQGLKVWWDKLCLLPGQPWEEGFCDGLVNSSCFVCLLSRNAINHPDKAWQNFCKLEAGSRCDNVLLEWRLALELQERRMIEGVYPILIGDKSSMSSSDDDDGAKVVQYSEYQSSGCHPSQLPDVAVGAVESKLREHLARQGLGEPLKRSRTVSEVVHAVMAHECGVWRGLAKDAVADMTRGVCHLRARIEASAAEDVPQRLSVVSCDESQRSLRSFSRSPGLNVTVRDRHEMLLGERKLKEMELNRLMEQLAAHKSKDK